MSEFHVKFYAKNRYRTNRESAKNKKKSGLWKPEKY